MTDDVMKAASVAAIRRALNKQGLHGQTQRHAPLSTTRNIKGGLEYARRNLDRTAEFWERVLWADETELELFGHGDQQYVWHEKGRIPSPQRGMEVGH